MYTCRTKHCQLHACMPRNTQFQRRALTVSNTIFKDSPYLAMVHRIPHMVSRSKYLGFTSIIISLFSVHYTEIHKIKCIHTRTQSHYDRKRDSCVCVCVCSVHLCLYILYYYITRTKSLERCNSKCSLFSFARIYFEKKNRIYEGCTDIFMYI